MRSKAWILLQLENLDSMKISGPDPNFAVPYVKGYKRALLDVLDVLDESEIKKKAK